MTCVSGIGETSQWKKLGMFSNKIKLAYSVPA